jgi:hypothetical protein
VAWRLAHNRQTDAIFLHRVGLKGDAMFRWCSEVVASGWHIVYECCEAKELRRALKQTLKTITGTGAVLVHDVHCGFFLGRCKSKDARMVNYMSKSGKVATYKCFTATEKNTRTSADYRNYFQSEMKRRVLMEYTVHRA